MFVLRGGATKTTTVAIYKHAGIKLFKIHPSHTRFYFPVRSISVLLFEIRYCALVLE